MATEKQYDVFKSLYDEEVERYVALEGRAKLYLTIITFYLGTIAFKIKDVMDFVTKFGIPIWLYLGLSIVLLIALLLTVLATRIRSYEGVCDPEQLFNEVKKGDVNDERFLGRRLADLAIATNRNIAENNRVAMVLQFASYLLFAAVSLQLIIFIMAVLRAQ